MADGPTEKVVGSYLSFASEDAERYAGERVWDEGNEPGNDIVRLTAIRTKNENGMIRSEFDVTEPVIFEFEYMVLKQGHQIASIIELSSESQNQVVIRAVDDYSRGPWGKQSPARNGTYSSKCIIPKNLLGEGKIIISLRIFSPPFAANLSELVKALNVISFEVTDSMRAEGSRGTYPYPLGEAIRPKLDWETTRISTSLEKE